MEDIRNYKSEKRPRRSLFICNRAPGFGDPIPSVTQVVSSSQAHPRHTKIFTYRCFLPDLTRFMSFRCVGPNRQRHLLEADLTIEMPGPGIRSCYSGLQVQGTATSPSSTVMAEREGFEPSRRSSRLHDFQSCAFDQLSHLSMFSTGLHYRLKKRSCQQFRLLMEHIG